MDQLRALNLHRRTGHLRFTLDPMLLDQIKKEFKDKYVPPKFQYSAAKQQVRILHTAYVEYEDTSPSGYQETCDAPNGKEIEYYKLPRTHSDFAILPIEFEVRFNATVTNVEGEFPSISMEHVKSRLNLKPC